MSRRVESAYDVVVCGGGAAGIGAAVGAAKVGARVCLVEKYGFLGGAATNAQVLAYCGLFQQGQTPVRAAAGVAQEVVSELKNHRLDGEAFRSESTGNWVVLLDPEVLKFALDRVVLAYGIDVKLHTRLAVVARTCERIETATLAGMDGRSHVVADSFVDASGDANLAMLAGVECRIGDEEGQLQALTMPLRIGGIAPDLHIDRAALCDVIAGYNQHGRYPMAGRARAHAYVEMLRCRMPGFENAYLVATGPQVGVRETRHPEARYEITREDALQGARREDGIARAAWPIELHGEAGKPVYLPIGGSGFFHVPYDAIRAKGIANLWYGGRVIGADPHAYGSIRVMGTAFATGQAAGVAAADYVDTNDEVDVQRVRKRLSEQDALL